MPRMSELKCYLEQKKLENTKLNSKNVSFNINYNANNYEIFFQNMGIIKLSEGHRIKHVKTVNKDCFVDIVFQLSDNLSSADFIKNIDHIQEKIMASNLSIFSENGNMIFRIVKEDLPMVEYKLQKLQSNLIPYGVDLENQLLKFNLSTDPNILIGGVPGCGKSTLLNSMILHILYNHLGDLYLIDLKGGIEFGVYENCYQVKSYSEDVDDSYVTIANFKKEMKRRVKLLKDAGVKKYEEYIKIDGKLKRYFLIIDEFTDLMPTKKTKDDDYDICSEIVNIARKARATGGHIILATQRPSRECLPPTLKAVCSGVIGFRCANVANSKIIIDETGLETLENRQFISICEGYKKMGRTMFLKEDLLMDTVQKYHKKNRQKNNTELIKNDNKQG